MFEAVVKEVVTLKPADDSSGEKPAQRVLLSCHDLIMPPVMLSILCIYEDYIDHKELLESLRKVLKRFPLLAGSFSEAMPSEEKGEEKEQQLPVKAISLDNSGVSCAIAECDASLDDFGDFSVSKNKAAFSFPLHHSVENAVMTVQITYLKPTQDGRRGTIVAPSISHLVADAGSMCHFVNSWAAETRGTAHASKLPTPYHDRQHFDSLESTEGQVASPPPLRYEPPETLMPTMMEWMRRIAGANTEVFDFSADALQRLKKHASPSEGWISTHDALTALLWQATTRMKNLDDSLMVRVSTSCNVKKRLDPPLPDGYFGNAVQTPVAELPAQTVKTAPLSELAAALRAAIQGFSDKTIKANLAWMREHQRKGTNMSCLRPNWGFNDLCTTSWVAYPFYDSDFGHGRPLFVGTGFSPIPGYSVLLPGPAEGSIRVLLHYSADEAKGFEQWAVPTITPFL